MMDENVLGEDEAYSLLQNGIFVETSKGLVCMSLNDAISSDLNLSVEDLKNVATELISQQVQDKMCVKAPNFHFDSDGFSSECSDMSGFIAVENKLDPKLVAFVPLKTLPPDVTVLNSNLEVKQEPVDPLALEQPPDIILTSIEVHKPPKRRGGWPKGRKRKPELKNLPPKAPATGYNLYLNEQRKLFKDSKLVFHEITKVIGNKWSNLSLEAKRPYLAKAEEDKRRYREELKLYRQSDAYRTYLAKKRRKRLQNNVLSESDMDATDEIDDEDNEELYCRTCDQWFHNLHNKREHLQGRQHTQSVAGDIKKELDTEERSASDSAFMSTSLDESSMDAMPNLMRNAARCGPPAGSVSDCIVSLVTAVEKREGEIRMLQRRLMETSMAQNVLCQQLNALRQRHVKLKQDLSNLREQERSMEAKVSQLWQVPSWFIITDFTDNAETSTDFNEGSE